MEKYRSIKSDRTDTIIEKTEFNIDLEESKLGRFGDNALAEVETLGKQAERVPRELQDAAMAAFGYAEQALRNYRASATPAQRDQWEHEYHKACERLRAAHEAFITTAKGG